MTPNEYQRLALRTAPPSKERTLIYQEDRLIHGAIGLCGEVGEIYQNENCVKNMLEEIGDCLWYISLILDGAGYQLDDIFYNVEVGDVLEELVVNTSIIADQIKRLIYYKADFTNKFEWAMERTLQCLHLLAKQHDSTLHTCMEVNINKLKIRYPNNFDESHAINRNTEREAKAFEV